MHALEPFALVIGLGCIGYAAACWVVPLLNWLDHFRVPLPAQEDSDDE